MRPKPGFDIGKQNQGPILVTVLEPKNFLTKLFCFEKIEIEHRSKEYFKNLKYLAASCVLGEKINPR